MKVVLIRHPAPLIEPGICYGRLDIPLHPAAVEDIAALVAHPDLRGISTVRCSPANRCRVVAERIARAAETFPIIDEKLRELDFGDWEGRPWNTLDRVSLDRWAAAPLLFVPPNGESGAAIVSRVRAFHADLMRDHRDCVVVSHGGPLKILAALLDGRSVDLLSAAPPLGSVRAFTACP
jgi:alpha-ribazole phosphatase